MLFVKNIAIVQFKKHLNAHYSFKQQVVGICGKNGSGKTNLLDAIYCLCFTKSYFNKQDAQLTTHGYSGWRLAAEIKHQENEHELVCILRENGKKEFLKNGVAYKKFAEHIGLFPAVMIAPDDIAIINEGSEERRRMMDTILSQSNNTYLQQLMQYNKLLLQRNALLKAMNEQQKLADDLLSIYDEQIVQLGSYIHTERSKMMANFSELVVKFYNFIAENVDAIQLQYQSQILGKNYLELIQENRQRDVYMQRTSIGIHKDDVSFEIAKHPFKNTASQGQKKSLLFALKLAEFTYLQQALSITPLLLLDDVFEKLDDGRMQQLLNWVCNNAATQVFITDTQKQRLALALASINKNFEIIEL